MVRHDRPSAMTDPAVAARGRATACLSIQRGVASWSLWSFLPVFPALLLLEKKPHSFADLLAFIGVARFVLRFSLASPWAEPLSRHQYHP
ncbi:hypothetical protein [Brevibacillus sp. SAFN-007a]|uniref:hypothetical protein n=1 Tax=Brevibacillus sp. SAFN-007a TaxID=3436862 RepID=UPI003F7FB30E